MAKILGIGNAVLDIILTVPHYPHEDEEIRAVKKSTVVGGNVNNSLYVLNQLGHATAICTTVAADSEAKMLLTGLKERNISTDHIQKFIKGRTPSSFVTLNAENGHRSIVHFRDLPEVTFDFFAKIEIEEYDWLHFEGRNLEHLPGMLNIAKTFLSNQPISLEIEKPRDGIEELIPLANLVIFSHHYAQAKGFNDGHALLSEIQKTTSHSNLVCTWGNQGVWYASPNGEVLHTPAEVINPVVDTLGAGDTFNGGLIHYLIEGFSLSESVNQANKLAAQKCRQHGLDKLLEVKQTDKPLANMKQLSNAKTLIVNSGSQSVLLIKHEESVKAYLNNCPHQNVPLNEAYKIDVNPFEKTMKCSVHDAFFNIEDGVCIEGPCWNEALATVDIRIDDKGDIFLGS